jgi:PAS domain S-box-containing protein
MTDSRAKVLCVDDDPELLLINSSMLQSAGHQVFEASNGNECIRIAKDELPDIILLDVILPDMHGFEVCRQIKCDPKLASASVILISGIEYSADSQVRGIEAGADGYITRPLSTKELLARIQAMIRIKKTEAALRKSMEMYHMLVETMTDGLCVLSEAGFITFANQRICEMIGCPRDEIVGFHITDFIHEEGLQSFQEQFDKIERGIFNPFELVCRKKDGENIITVVTPRPIFDSQGVFRGACAVITDITERRRAEQEIFERDERLRNITARVPGLVFQARFDGNENIFFTFVSEGIRETFEVDSEDVLGDAGVLFRLLHPEDAGEVEQSSRRACRGQAHWEFDFRIITPGGREKCIRGSAVPQLLPDGQYVWNGVAIDITELRKAEEEIRRLNEILELRVIERTLQLEAAIEELENEILERRRMETALRDSEKRYRTLVQAAPDVIYAYSEKGIITSLNASFETVTGWRSSDWIGQKFETLIHPDDLHIARDFFERSLRGEPSQSFELRILAKSGKYLVGEFMSSPQIDKGRVTGGFGIARDITYRRKAEETMRHYAERLQALSVRLLEVQEAERRFIAQELHDEIGQTLTGINLAIDVLMKTAPENIGASLSEVQNSVKDLMTRVRNISLDLRPSMLDDLGLLHALLWHFDRYALQTGIRVIFRHEGLDTRFSPEIETGAYRVIQEALTNIARHAGVNEAEVLVVAGSDTFAITIQDRGKGFDPERAQCAGNTIGLEGMKERLVLLGGRLTLESGPGKGTRLLVEIPLKHCRVKERSQDE